MKKKYYKNVDYEELFFSTIKEKYFNFILGITVSFIASFFLFNLLLKKNINKPVFSLSTLGLKVVSPTLKPTITAKTYIVLEGDDLWHIAEKFYGSGFNAYDISVANKIDPNSSIEAGQKLIIPEVKRREATIGEISAASTTQVTYTEGKYVVQPGDSLSTISQKVYGDLYSWLKILQANNLQNPDQIEVGMVLTVPR